MARNTETKNIFRNASKNAGSFVRDIIFGKPTQAGERGITREGGFLKKCKIKKKVMEMQDKHIKII